MPDQTYIWTVRHIFEHWPFHTIRLNA